MTCLGDIADSGGGRRHPRTIMPAAMKGELVARSMPVAAITIWRDRFAATFFIGRHVTMDEVLNSVISDQLLFTTAVIDSCSIRFLLEASLSRSSWQGSLPSAIARVTSASSSSDKETPYSSNCRCVSASMFTG